MSYNLKQAMKRGTAFVGAMGLLGAFAVSALPAATFADALNPLTERTLTLSSSSPGWSFTDGSGNSTYAGPGTGPNGQKTSETFTFKTSTDSTTSPTIKGFSFQYCNNPAGTCLLPGNGSFNVAAATSNLDVHYTTSAAENTDFNVYYVNSLSDEQTAAETTYDAASADVQAKVDQDLSDAEALFVSSSGDEGVDESNSGDVDAYKLERTHFWQDAAVKAVYDSLTPDPSWKSTGWTVSSVTQYVTSGTPTEKNYLTLSNSTGINPAAGAKIWVQLKASDTSYITNPGDLTNPFYVRINDYDTDDISEMLGPGNSNPEDGSHVVDGGVTVANVTNESIHITTKVLETMTFSVGTANPDTYDVSAEGGHHGVCDTLWHNPVTNPVTGDDDEAAADNQNPATPDAYDFNLIRLGDPSKEFSLSSSTSYDANSWWRLSTNSSAGAVVYYSGETLFDTVGDHITAIGENKGTPAASTYNQEATSSAGSEQFGLALDQSGETINHSASGDDSEYGANGAPSLAPLEAEAHYGDGAGTITSGGTAKFAFNRNSLNVPQPIASEDHEVINCSTGKMRYIANIQGSTPAGVYTTKINYIAAPQY